MMNAARTGQYLESVYGDEIAQGPSVNTAPMAQSVGRRDSLPAASASAPNALGPGIGPVPFTPHPYTPTPPPAMPQAQLETAPLAHRSRAPRKKSVLPLVLALLAVLAIVVGGGGAFAVWLIVRVPGIVPPRPPPLDRSALLPSWRVDAGAPFIPALPVIPAVPAQPGTVAERPSPGTTDVAAPPGTTDVTAPHTPHESSRTRAHGTLAINTRPWSKVYVGSRLLGTTPLGGLSVPVGTVSLRLVDRDGVTHRRTVRVEAGEPATAFFDLSQE